MGIEAIRAPGAVVRKPSRLHDEHVLPRVAAARGGLPRSSLNSDKWDRDEERHTGPLRTNWQKKSSVFKFSADEEGKKFPTASGLYYCSLLQ